MRKLPCLMLIVPLLCVSGCGRGSSANPLIGKWLVEGSNNRETMLFTADRIINGLFDNDIEYTVKGRNTVLVHLIIDKRTRQRLSPVFLTCTTQTRAATCVDGNKGSTIRLQWVGSAENPLVGQWVSTRPDNSEWVNFTASRMTSNLWGAFDSEVDFAVEGKTVTVTLPANSVRAPIELKFVCTVVDKDNISCIRSHRRSSGVQIDYTRKK